MYNTYYLDENDNLVASEEEAVKIIYQELDENGNLIKESYSYTKNYHPEESERVKNHVLSEDAKHDIDEIRRLLNESSGVQK